MTSAGTQVGRQWVVVLSSGVIAIDWGNNLYQDVFTGEFIQVSEAQISHTIQESELDWLHKSGRVLRYDELTVDFPVLPDRPYHLME